MIRVPSGRTPGLSAQPDGDAVSASPANVRISSIERRVTGEPSDHLGTDSRHRAIRLNAGQNRSSASAAWISGNRTFGTDGKQLGVSAPLNSEISIGHHG